MNAEAYDIELSRKRWKTRRLMSWFAFFSGLAFPFIPVEKEIIISLAPVFYLFVTGVVMSYITMSTVDTKWTK